MERVVSLTTFDEERKRNAPLEYWLSRPPEKRIAEVERLRREYFRALRGTDYDGRPEGLCRTCSLLNERGVEFLIVGGYAVGYHGAPRFTGDLTGRKPVPLAKPRFCRWRERKYQE
jgi:hypothetical protein